MRTVGEGIGGALGGRGCLEICFVVGIVNLVYFDS